MALFALDRKQAPLLLCSQNWARCSRPGVCGHMVTHWWQQWMRQARHQSKERCAFRALPPRAEGRGYMRKSDERITTYRADLLR
jgi:hypothetical protein